MSSKRKFWVAGISLAIVGVVLARVVSQHYNQPAIKLAIYMLGVLLALSGLGLIMYAIRTGRQE